MTQSDQQSRPTRRILLGMGAAGGLGLLSGVSLHGAPVAAQTTTVQTPAQAIQRLTAGNRRFVSGMMQHPNQTIARRVEIAPKQSPFAIVVGCSDSRVPPEIVFDEGLGDLFIVRVAGNVIDEAGLGSIEFAAQEFTPTLILVLGHTNCAAVAGAISVVNDGVFIPGALGNLIYRIVPAAVATRSDPGDWLANATRRNVRNSIEAILASEPVLATQEQRGNLEIEGAIYDLTSGVVEFLNL